MRSHLVTAAAALALLVPAVALAEEVDNSHSRERVAAPSQAFEATVGMGYTQPFGSFQSGVDWPDVARAGIGTELACGYRIEPHWGLSLGGQYYELNAKSADVARGFAFTLAAQYHIVPTARLDPWIELGTGYRMLWQVHIVNSPTVLDHGVELARARAGFDLRVSPDIAVTPVIGADATMFLWQDAGNGAAISDPRVTTFVFLGAQGRFDVGGTRVDTAATTSIKPE